MSYIPGGGPGSLNSLRESARTRKAAKLGEKTGTRRMSADLLEAAADEGVTHDEVLAAAKEQNPYFRLAAEMKAKELAAAEGVDMNGQHIEAAKDLVTQSDMEAAYKAQQARDALRDCESKGKPHLATATNAGKLISDPNP